MARNRYYYYDPEVCSFKEVRPSRRERAARSARVVALALVLAAMTAWAMDARWIGTPEEAALEAENRALQQQIANVGQRMQSVTSNLEELETTDEQLYRTLLRADPIPEDVRQVGVGGSDAYEEYDRFGGSTASMMRKTATAIDELERRMGLQSASFRRLKSLAVERQEGLQQLPALVPSDGPVVSGFGIRQHPILRVRKMHAGIDVLVRTGTPVVATGAGVVKRVARGPGFGKFIEIDHPAAGYSTLYAHLSETADGLRAGHAVERGQQIGLSGNTGRSTGPHLHYEVHDDEGRAVNPVYFFAPSMTPSQYQKMLRQAQASGISLD